MTSERPHIEVFTRASCAPCRRIESYFEARGVAFTKRDVVTEPAALEALVAQGYTTTPVTRIGGTWIAGFKRKALDKLLDGAGAG